MEDICRLCLGNGQLLNIFEDAANLPVRIMACCSLEVNSNDNLPKFICVDCRYQLDKTYIFRIKSKNAESKLKRHIRLINAGKVSHVFEEEDDADEYADALLYVQQHEETLKSGEHDNLQQQLSQYKANEVKLRNEMKRVKEQMLNQMQVIDDLRQQLDRQTDENYVLEMLEDDPDTKILRTKVEAVPGPSNKGKNKKGVPMVIDEETEDGSYIVEEEEESQDPIETRFECDPEEYAAIEKAVRATLGNQPNYSVKTNFQLKLEKLDSALTKAEVITDDGSILFMEFNTENVVDSGSVGTGTTAGGGSITGSGGGRPA